MKMVAPISTLEPVAFVEFEGGEYEPWTGGRRRPERVHAIVFSNGDIFDTRNGWRENRPEAVKMAGLVHG